MSRWFRHYAGMGRDDKLVRAALRSKQTVERVVWVWTAILESAAEIDDGGRYEIDHAEIAYFLRADEADIAAVESALDQLGRVSEGIVARWGDRQFQSDRSAERTKRYRDRQQGHSDGRSRSRDADVTAEERHRDAPETDTETEKKKAAGHTRADFDALRDRLLDAAGQSVNRTTGGLEVLAAPLAWLSDGADLDLDILPAIRAAAARSPPGRIRSWAFFTDAIADHRATRTAPLPTGTARYAARAPNPGFADATQRVLDRLDAREGNLDHVGSDGHGKVIVAIAGRG